MAKLPNGVSQEFLAHLADVIRSIRFGSVQITIHDAKIVQIDKVEKVRLASSADLTPGRQPESSPTDRTPGGQRPVHGR